MFKLTKTRRNHPNGFAFVDAIRDGTWNGTLVSRNTVGKLTIGGFPDSIAIKQEYSYSRTQFGITTAAAHTRLVL